MRGVKSEVSWLVVLDELRANVARLDGMIPYHEARMESGHLSNGQDKRVLRVMT